MNPTTVFDSPQLTSPRLQGKWEAEYEAFLKLLPGLLSTHRGRYVAIHEGKVVGTGSDKLAVARAAYGVFGPVEILVRLVTDQPPRVVQLVSPQLDRAGSA